MHRKIFQRRNGAAREYAARRGASGQSTLVADIQISTHLITLPPPMALMHVSRLPHLQCHALASNIATGFAVVVPGAFTRASMDDTGDVIVGALALHRSPVPQPHPCLQRPFPATSGPSDPLYTLAQRPRRAPI